MSLSFRKHYRYEDDWEKAGPSAMLGQAGLFALSCRIGRSVACHFSDSRFHLFRKPLFVACDVELIQFLRICLPRAFEVVGAREDELRDMFLLNFGFSRFEHLRRRALLLREAPCREPR